jgi:hypothetical protein
MSLKSQFKTDVNAARDGVWFNYPANPDGTVPRFKLRRAGPQNKDFQAAVREVNRHFTDEVTGEVDIDALTGEEGTVKSREAFLRTVIADWDNFQPEEDGNSVAFSPEAAVSILGAPEWIDLVNDLTMKSNKGNNYRMKELESSAKNS